MPSPRASAAICCRCAWRGCSGSRPTLRRVALSATVADADSYRAWLAPDGDIDAVTLVEGEAGAEPNIAILLPEDRVPWAGHSGRYAAEQVMAEIETHSTTLVFCNTRQPGRTDLPGSVEGQ